MYREADWQEVVLYQMDTVERVPLRVVYRETDWQEVVLYQMNTVEGVPLRVVHREADWPEMALYHMDTAEGLPLNRVGHRENAPEDTFLHMMLLQDKSFVQGKATILDMVLVQSTPRVGEPSHENLRLEVQHPDGLPAGAEALAVAPRGCDS